MSVKLLIEHLLEFLGLSRGCRGWFESTLSKCQIVGNLMPLLICLLENIPIGGEVNWHVNTIIEPVYEISNNVRPARPQISLPTRAV